MSATILERRNDYYNVLEQCQRNTTDITPWILWFLEILEETLQSSEHDFIWKEQAKLIIDHGEFVL